MKIDKDYSIIYDCCRLKNSVEINMEVIKMIRARSKAGFKCNRTIKSYYNEILAHKRLYNLHLFRTHTKDVDLEENTKLLNEIIWKVLSL